MTPQTKKKQINNAREQSGSVACQVDRLAQTVHAAFVNHAFVASPRPQHADCSGAGGGVCCFSTVITKASLTLMSPPDSQTFWILSNTTVLNNDCGQ